MHVFLVNYIHELVAIELDNAVAQLVRAESQSRRFDPWLGLRNFHEQIPATTFNLILPLPGKS